MLRKKDLAPSLHGSINILSLFLEISKRFNVYLATLEVQGLDLETFIIDIIILRNSFDRVGESLRGSSASWKLQITSLAFVLTFIPLHYGVSPYYLAKK